MLQPQVIQHGFQDVWSVRAGGSYRVPIAGEMIELRGGASYDTAAAPVSWTRVDLDGAARLTLSGGLAFEFDRYRVDAGFAWVHEGTITVVDEAQPAAGAPYVQPNPIQPSATTANQKFDPFNAGTYRDGYIVGMVGLTAKW